LGSEYQENSSLGNKLVQITSQQRSWVWWFTLVIQALWEVEIEVLQSKTRLWAKARCYLKNKLKAKRADLFCFLLVVVHFFTTLY
jgi:hypothetical protein